MFNVLTAAFVIACGLLAMSGAVWVIVQDVRRKPAARDLAEAIEEATVIGLQPHGPRPDWLYAKHGRMDIPRKRPLVRTRNSQ